MTRRSLELIAQADAILYDRLIPAGALDGARDDAELIYVGKAPGEVAMPQEEINARLVELGKAGKTVVRLKGGDPFVFGRGGEEAEALRAAGIEFEVVPGVTSGVAAPAYAGIPVTHRDLASAVAFVTGHEDPAKDESALDWDALAAFPGTLVLYMGVKNLARIAESLIAAGRPADQPSAVIERGTLPGQHTATAPLSEIAARVEGDGLRAPAITVIGPAAGLRETLAWIEARPLHGKVVAVTRARAQASGLAARLAALGAEVIEAPAIRIEPLPVEIGDPSRFALICFTSPNGVSLFFDALEGDARALAGVTVAAIGPGTARDLAARGVNADVVPPRSVAESLVEELERVDVEGRRVLVARAGEARDVLPDALRERGAEVEVLALYETVAEPLSDEQREALGRATHITFTSSSTVRFFLDAFGGPLDGARVVSIGPVTSATRARAGPGRARGGRATRHRRAGGRAAGGRRVIVTLLTDYGRDDDFVGVCHGVIAGIAPDATIVDITHGIPRYDVRLGALVLRNTLPFMPVGVHVAVVDPQVGTERRAVALRSDDGRLLVGPDNGLLSLAWGAVEIAVDISRSPHRLEPVSATFHGRDVFAPVAAALAGGAPIEDAGTPLAADELVRVELPEARVEDGALVGHVLTVDRFGNAGLNVSHEELAGTGITLGSTVEIEAGGEQFLAAYAGTFADVGPGELIVYEDAYRSLAIAINRGDAGATLGLRADAEVRLRPR